MLLPTNHKDHVFDNSVVELLLRRTVDGIAWAVILDAAAVMIWLLIS
jgi:hypothetical protein